MHKVLITGGSGYVGAMLVREFSKRQDVEAILAVDKEPASELYAGNRKVSFVQANLCDEEEWMDDAIEFAPDIVIHTAWQIREMYGKKDLQWKWNIEGSDAVFDFVFGTPSVKRFIHFSTVASYGAFPDNEISHLFTESEPFRKTDYLYAEEKRIAEDHLEKKYAEARERARAAEGELGVEVRAVPQVFVVRPAAVTGPRGRYMRVRFGLQAALSGQLKETPIHRLISAMVSFVPVTKKWCRQFIHEDDVNDIVELLSFENLQGEYEVFNICPPGPVVTGKDMAKAVGKKAVPIHPYLIRLAFFCMWHVSRGKVPTSRGGWKSYSYPIAVDGSKLSKMYGYKYRFEPQEAFVKREGRYMEFVK